MRRHLRNPWVWVVAGLLCAGWLLWPRPVKSPPVAEPPAVESPAATATAAAGEPEVVTAAERIRSVMRTPADDVRLPLPAFLPAEAHATVALIARDGPFPHAQDGQTFGNREGHLPAKPRGYYREYTVETPGLSHRGARRIVTGGTPPEVWYYTDDHYDSFRAFEVGAGTLR